MKTLQHCPWPRLSSPQPDVFRKRNLQVITFLGNNHHLLSAVTSLSRWTPTQICLLAFRWTPIYEGNLPLCSLQQTEIKPLFRRNRRLELKKRGCSVVHTVHAHSNSDSHSHPSSAVYESTVYIRSGANVLPRLSLSRTVASDSSLLLLLLLPVRSYRDQRTEQQHFWNVSLFPLAREPSLTVIRFMAIFMNSEYSSCLTFIALVTLASNSVLQLSSAWCLDILLCSFSQAP